MLSIYSKKITRFFFFVVLGLTLVSLLGNFSRQFLGSSKLASGLKLLFDVDSESNLPTWYSSVALLLCGLLLAIIAALKKQEGDRFAFHWKVLSFIFLFLSLDEVVGIHELPIAPLRQALHASGFFYFAWVIPGAILVLFFVLAYLKFLAHLPAKTRYMFFLAGLVFVGGALGAETLSGYYADFYKNFGSEYSERTPYIIAVAIEEFCEMIGIVIFIQALLTYLSSYLKQDGLTIYLIDEKERS
jgi:hypothetical protein